MATRIPRSRQSTTGIEIVPISEVWNDPVSATERRGTKVAAGSRYGKLTVLTREPVDASRKVKFLCSCDCGQQYVAESYALRNGTTKHCGCDKSARAAAATTHGKRHTRVYYAWKNMMTRCYRVSGPDYHSYGGRGILVCDRWHKFDNFLEDMGEPGEGLTLERDRVNEGYSKANCRWATMAEQSRNRRDNRLIEYEGKVRCLVDIAAMAGVPYKQLHGRLAKGIPLQRALSHNLLKREKNENSTQRTI